MIASLRGTILKKKENYIIVENNGIGYKVFVSEIVLSANNTNDEIFLFIYQQVREAELNLFGFLDFEEHDLFEKLISVSGIGPKTALGVFTVASLADIKSAIINQDASILKKVSGIGAKTADRIVLELKNKVAGLVGHEGVKSSEEMAADTDVVEALESLGYQGRQAREVLKQIDKDITDSGEKVRAALKLLTK
jgi:holliday junction DNA helicase RuvA